jgi:hypothetical protein
MTWHLTDDNPHALARIVGGVIRESRDDATATVTSFAEDGLTVTGTRPYTPAEQAAAARRVVAADMGVTIKQVAAAAARVAEIKKQADALSASAPLTPKTTAQLVTAVTALDNRQRAIAAGIADVASYVRALAKVVLRD